MMKKKTLALFVLASLASSQSFAAGFEKALFWSGKYAGAAGAATAAVRGSEAIYFNPAGLAAGRKGGDITLNVSPTFASYSGMFTGLTAQQTTGTKFTPPGAITASYNLTEQWGVGIGYYASAGAKAVYENVDYSSRGFSIKPNAKNDLSVTEFSVGTGYEILPGLRIGGAWRLVHVAADFASVTYTTTPVPVLIGVDLNGLSATRYNGWKFGAQYTSADESWGLGFNWRTEVGFSASAPITGVYQSLTAASNGTISGATTGTLGNKLPNQFVLGGYYDLMPKKLRILPELTFTKYSVNQFISISGTFSAGSTIGTSRNLTNILQDWQDQWNARLGFEYAYTDNLMLRFGYVYTSRVTGERNARATFAAPGAGHSIALGAGTSVLDKTIDLNGALDYSLSTGSGTNQDDTRVPAGDYKVEAITAHLGASYKF